MDKSTPGPVEVIDGRNLSLVTYETKPLLGRFTIGFHTNKVVFNVISSLRNPIIIGLSWFVLHNPQMDWHMKNLHFETPQHEAFECETFEKNMQNLKHKENLDGTIRLRCPKILFVGTKTFMKAATKGDAFLLNPS
jgi:hypothetical protein